MTNLPSYLDFVVDVTTMSEHTYMIAARSDAGEARQISEFPLDASALVQGLHKLEAAITGSVAQKQAQASAAMQSVQDFGRTLFDFLLPSETRTLYYESLREAVHRNRGVRLKLSIHAPQLATLPWEFLFDPRKRDYVCLDPHTPLVRYTELPQTSPPLAVEAPLRILGVIADPEDMHARLDVAEERKRVSEALRSLEERGVVQLTWLEGETWRDLQRAMRTGSCAWHIFHFIGHGGYDEIRNEGYIMLADEQGKAHQLYATQLARLLARQRSSLRLVMLNACEGARTGQLDLLSGTAVTLINSGIPAVLAMQYGITDAAAVEFARTFYEALADNLPVDAAVAEARNAINFNNATSLEWGVPVLHSRAADGRLFAMGAEDVPAKPFDNVQHRSYVPGHSAGPQTNTAEDEVLSVQEDDLANNLANNFDWLQDELCAHWYDDEFAEESGAEGEEEIDVAAVLNAAKHQAAYLEFSGAEANTQADLSGLATAPQATSHPSPSQREGAAHPLLLETPDELVTLSELLQSGIQHHLSLLNFDWVTIPAGEFWMGSDPAHDIHAFEDEQPQFKYYLPTYRITRVPITNAQYRLFVEATRHRSPTHWIDGQAPDGLDAHPVVNISWRDANAFCEWAGVRLPTEAEWEKAARGPDARIYPWGDEAPNSRYCNYDMQVGAPVAVGQYPAGASPYGVLDMVGNTWEWTASVWLDSYENYARQIANSDLSNLRRVLRGGGFRDFEFVRCAARSWDLHTQRYLDLGFRVVALD
ncbi:MAG: SUMF1/EgtB/PvdO family nonheme iron enzyme [Caldilineaceae bacterium]